VQGHWSSRRAVLTNNQAGATDLLFEFVTSPTAVHKLSFGLWQGEGDGLAIGGQSVRQGGHRRDSIGALCHQ